MKLRYLKIVIGCILLVGCTKQPTTSIDLDKIRAKNQVEIKEVPKESFNKLLYPYTPEEANKKIYQYVNLTVNPKIITNEQARKDINYLFEMLKYGYPAYQFFGGTQKFELAKQTILESIGSNQVVSREDLIELLLTHLSFVQDTHFNIEKKSNVKLKMYFSYGGWDLYDDKDGYYFIEEGNKCYITHIDGKTALSEYMKPTISKNGDLVYHIGFVDLYTPQLNQGKSVSVTIKKGNCEEKQEILCQLETREYQKKNKNAVGTYEIEGIKVLEINTFITKDEESIRECVEEIRQSPNCIIDFRGNSGGEVNNVISWMYNFSYERPKDKELMVTLETDTTTKIGTDNQEDPTLKVYEGTNRGWVNFRMPEHVSKQGNQNIYVLIDKVCASATEDFIKKIREYAAVTLIGTNTMGAMITNDIKTWYLPNSKIEIKSGRGFSLDTDLKNRDGEGIMPDLWVNPTDALANTIRYIRSKK